MILRRVHAVIFRRVHAVILRRVHAVILRRIHAVILRRVHAVILRRVHAVILRRVSSDPIGNIYARDIRWNKDKKLYSFGHRGRGSRAPLPLHVLGNYFVPPTPVFRACYGIVFRAKQ